MTYLFIFYFIIHLPPELLPVLGLWNGDVIPKLDAALLCSSRAGSDIHTYNTHLLEKEHIEHRTCL